MSAENVILVTIRDKVATADKTVYVCGNSGFTVEFDFDSEWDEFKTKTARFICDDASYVDVLFDGKICPIPILSNTHRVRVGVYAGNLVTTTPAYITASKSILCDGGTPADPPDDVYNQLMEKLNKFSEEEFDRIENEIAQTATELAEQITALGEQDTALSGQIGTLSGQVNTQGQQITSLSQKDTAIEGQISAQAKKISDLEAKDGSLEQQIGSLNSQGETMASDIADLKKQLDDMNYGTGISIGSFNHNAGNRERGSKITTLTLSWSYGNEKTLKEQKVEGYNLSGGTLGASVRQQPVSGLSITADSNTWKTWTLTATDTRNKTVSKTTPGFTFLNRVYYGAAEAPENGLSGVDSAFILALSSKSDLTNTRKRTITVNGDGKYIWYCLPKELGKCSFKDTTTGFSAGIENYTEVEFNNGVGDEGYTETYYVYQSNQKIASTKEIEVS